MKRLLRYLLTRHFDTDVEAEIRAHIDEKTEVHLGAGLPIEEASAKIRAGGPLDDDEDLALPVWAGHVPLALHALDPIALDGAHALPKRPRGL